MENFKAHLVASKESEYFLVPANDSLISAQLIKEDGTILKSLYSNQVPTSISGLSYFKDINTESGKFLVSNAATIAEATAVTAVADLPSWAAAALASDKVVKVSATGIQNIVTTGDLILIDSPGKTLPVYGRVSGTGTGFVECIRVASSVDTTKLLPNGSDYTVYLITERYGEPMSNPAISMKILNSQKAEVILPTSYKMEVPQGRSYSGTNLTIDLAPFIRADIIEMGTNTYGQANALFPVDEILSDTKVVVKTPSNFRFVNGTSTVVSDASKNEFIQFFRGMIGEKPNVQVPISPTTDLIRVNGVAAGAAENDNLLLIVTTGTELAPIRS